MFSCSSSRALLWAAFFVKSSLAYSSFFLMPWFIHWFRPFSPPPQCFWSAFLSPVLWGSCLFSHLDNTWCLHLFPDQIRHIVITSCLRIVPPFARHCCQFHAMYRSMFCASWSCHGYKSCLTRVVVKGVGMKHQRNVYLATHITLQELIVASSFIVLPLGVNSFTIPIKLLLHRRAAFQLAI